MSNRSSKTVPQTALANLLDAVDGVLAFDWCDNDSDAVEAVARLRKATEDYGVVQRLELSDETKPTRDAEHCDFPDCEQHWLYVAQGLRGTLQKIADASESFRPMALKAIAESHLPPVKAVETSAPLNLLREARLSVERDAESNCVCGPGDPTNCKYCAPLRGLLTRIDEALAGIRAVETSAPLTRFTLCNGKMHEDPNGRWCFYKAARGEQETSGNRACPECNHYGMHDLTCSKAAGYWQCPCCQNYYTSDRILCPVSGDSRPDLKATAPLACDKFSAGPGKIFCSTCERQEHEHRTSENESTP